MAKISVALVDNEIIASQRSREWHSLLSEAEQSTCYGSLSVVSASFHIFLIHLLLIFHDTLALWIQLFQQTCNQGMTLNKILHRKQMVGSSNAFKPKITFLT